MAKPAEYRPVFSDLATESVLAMPRRYQRKVMQHAYAIARYPFVESDYVIADASGRPIEHLLVDVFIFSYWVDHGSKQVFITEIETTH